MNKLPNYRAFSYATIALTLAAIGTLTIAENKSVFAQLTPDNTLGTENSIVTPQQLRDLIQGGAIRGNALFHSFDEFNVGDGGSVFFDLQNNTDILSIFTRVTGSNVSNILGTLGVLQDALNSDVLGNANLFLLNPNGITFGANANLQLNGSFFATTADGFEFDNFTFSASGGEAPPPLLTVSIPRFLSFRDNPGTITNQSVTRAENSRGRRIKVGLQVPQDQTIGFIGGEVQFLEGGSARSADGRIEIGAVGTNSLVSFTQIETSAGTTNYVLGYERVEIFQDILLGSESGERSEIFVNGDEGGGTIQLQGMNINLSNARVRSNGSSPSRDPGNILINSSILTIENTSQVEAQVLFEPEVGESTNGASIDINTGDLILRSGGGIGTFANLGTTGDGGNIIINATNSVQVFGSETGGLAGVFAQTLNESTGNAGNITINTPQLLVQGGGRVTASTRQEAFGNGGNITVNATEFIRIVGEASAGDNNPSFLASQSTVGSTGNGGDIIINTPQLILQDGGRIAASTSTEGDGGSIIVNATDFVQIIGSAQDVKDITAEDSISNFDTLGSRIASSVVLQETTGNGGEITINTPQLLIQDGGLIDASTEGIGNGGSIKLDISETILVEGTDSGIFSRAIEGSLGNAGSIDIDPQQITVQDSGTISVSNLGTGEAGILTIVSDNLTLDNSTITATTVSNNGGNITLDIADLLLLRNGNGNGNAVISATAGGQGTGGNLTIDTTFLVAFPNENSDITANASQGRGGNINITATGVFGIQFRNALTEFSDITATSDFGISGTVTLNTPETQINQEQIEQPEEVVDSSDIVSQSVCSDFGGESQLANTGRGGVPDIPGFITRNSVVDVDLVDEVLPAPPPEAIKPHHRTDVTFLDSNGEEFKPAMGAVLLPNGMVEFVDYNPAEVYRDMYAAAGCSN